MNHLDICIANKTRIELEPTEHNGEIFSLPVGWINKITKINKDTHISILDSCIKNLESEKLSTGVVLTPENMDWREGVNHSIDNQLEYLKEQRKTICG